LDDNYAAYEHNRRRGVPRHGAALLQGIVYCGRCGHKMMVQYKGGNEYLCNYLRGQTQAPVCQRLPADPVDQQVVAAFFEAQAPEDDLSRALSPALRETFSTLGQALPTLWHQDTLSRAQRKALLRCLMEKVVLDRQVPDTIATRIVWRGGAISELAVPCTVGTLCDVTGFAQMEAQILRLE